MNSLDSQARIAFVSEHISMTVDPGVLTVTGLYTFRRSAQALQTFTVSYPFPVTADMLFPDNIEVCRAIDQTYIPVNKHYDRDAVSFAVPFADADTVTVAVRYTQRITSNEALYILTTTAAWGTPLEFADFIISVPDTLSHVALSYTPDLTTMRDGRIIYYMERKQFMPDRDLVVRW